MTNNSWFPVMDRSLPILVLALISMTAVPYYAWANREKGPMTVWIKVHKAMAAAQECQRQTKQLKVIVLLIGTNNSGMNLDEDNNIKGGVLKDSVHLTRKGYEIWAAAMEPLLAEMMNQ